MPNLVAIVGRPNVGKSTLFNRLTESRKAIVDEVAGVTRDRHYGKADWNAKEFTLIDTGGYISGSEDEFEGEIRKQVEIAIREADILIFVVDATEGITALDEEVVKILRRSKKKVILVANKVDNNERISLAAEFYKFGMGEPFPISSVSGFGTGELLDALAENLEKVDEMTPEEEQIPKLAIVGRPNVGKSSFVNALLDEERNMVTPIAGTTRDALHTRYKRFGHDFILVDTAGLRKKAKVKEDIEFYSVMRTIKALEECDVCLLILDATQTFDAQDKSIFHLAEKNRKGVVVLVNKWDLVEKETQTMKEYEENLREKLMPFRDVPIVFMSALTKQRVLKALEAAKEVYDNKTRKIPTRKLNDILLPIIQATPPPNIKGKFVLIKFISQLPTKNPNFAFWCNLPQYINEPYKRFIENQMRLQFNFTGVPIELVFKKK
ncbi:MAG TPA: ribosome biogenesis GTPase Der [Bacteroidia bacterium]|jgi:GTP-binding protein|nr:ribosome biogenesis GTPase Der [Bacteroidia bacterium]